MKVVPDHIVPLGYDKYFRSDYIVGLEPVEEGRGPGSRTRVYVEGIAEPVMASPSDGAILRDMVEPGEGGGSEYWQLLLDLLDTLNGLDPILRRIVHDQANWDLDRLEERIRDALAESGGG